MKNILFILLLSVAFASQAQIKEDAVKPMMTNRLYTCFEVEYNALKLLDGLYEQGKFDTMDAVIAFWGHHCKVNERLFSINVLNSIRNNKFSEVVRSKDFLVPRMTSPVRVDSNIYRKQILYMLAEYKEAISGAFSDETYSEWMNENYAFPNDLDSYYMLYENYYDFLRFMARSLVGKREYSPLEQFFIRFYSSPDSVQYSELDSAAYAGTTLQQEYKGYKKYHNAIHGGSYGMQTGIWMPQDKLAHLGNHPSFGVHFGFKSYTTAWDLVLGLRTGPSSNSYTVYKEDSLFVTNKFTSLCLAYELTHTLWHRKKHQIDFLWGVGLEGIYNLSVDLDTASSSNENLTNSMSSFFVNAGLGYKFYVRNKVRNNVHKHSYLALQGKYYITDFKNDGGTDLHGNYITIGLVYGAYSHGYTKYPYLR
jgi:hypothetical protein